MILFCLFGKQAWQPSFTAKNLPVHEQLNQETFFGGLLHIFVDVIINEMIESSDQLDMALMFNN